MAPVAGFISQTLTNALPTFPRYGRPINQGYKWQLALGSDAAADVSKDTPPTTLDHGVRLSAGPGADTVAAEVVDVSTTGDGKQTEDLRRKTTLHVEFKGVRDTTIPMLNFQNAETTAKLARVFVSMESKMPWTAWDVCGVHGTTVVAFSRELKGVDVLWSSATSDPLHTYARMPPFRDEARVGTDGSMRRVAFWPHMAALHGRVVAEAILGGRMCVAVNPVLVGAFPHKVQGVSMEATAKRLGGAIELHDNRRIPFAWVHEHLLAARKEAAGDTPDDAVLVRHVQFAVEAIFTRGYRNTELVAAILALVDIAAIRARMPHGYSASTNPQSAAAIGKAVKGSGGGGKEYAWSVATTGSVAPVKQNKLLHLTVDWDVHIEHARLKLSYLKACMDKLSRESSGSVLLSFTVPRAFRSVRVDFSRRCSLSNYLFHHMRYLDANVAMSASPKLDLKSYHRWCSAEGFLEGLSITFHARSEVAATCIPTLPDAKHWNEMTLRYTNRVTLISVNRDTNRLAVFYADQGPLRFVCVHRSSVAHTYAQRVRHAEALLAVVSHTAGVITPLVPAPKIAETAPVKGEQVAISRSQQLPASATEIGILMAVLRGVFEPGPRPREFLTAVGGTVHMISEVLARVRSLPDELGDVIRKEAAGLRQVYDTYRDFQTQGKAAVISEADVISIRRMIATISACYASLSSRRGRDGGGHRHAVKATYGGFWKTSNGRDGGGGGGGRDRSTLTPNPLYKFRPRFQYVDYEALSLEMPVTMLSIPLGPKPSTDTHHLAEAYRRYMHLQRGMGSATPLPSGLLTAPRYDLDRAVLSYPNAARLGCVCKAVLNGVFEGDLNELSGVLGKQWGVAIIAKGEALAAKRPVATLEPLWVVYQPGYGSATLGLYDCGFRVAELTPFNEFQPAATTATVDAAHPSSSKAPMWSIGKGPTGPMPTGEASLVRMSILSSKEIGVTAHRYVPSPAVLSSVTNVCSVFIRVIDDATAVSEPLAQLLEPLSSSYVLFHARVTNYDQMTTELAVAPRLNIEDTTVFTRMVEHVCVRGIRKVFVVPLPISRYGPCTPFSEVLRIPRGTLDHFRVHTPSLDYLFVLTCFGDNNRNGWYIREHIAAAYDPAQNVIE